MLSNAFRVITCTGEPQIGGVLTAGGGANEGMC